MCANEPAAMNNRRVPVQHRRQGMIVPLHAGMSALPYPPGMQNPFVGYSVNFGDVAAKSVKGKARKVGRPKKAKKNVSTSRTTKKRKVDHTHGNGDFGNSSAAAAAGASSNFSSTSLFSPSHMMPVSSAQGPCFWDPLIDDHIMSGLLQHDRSHWGLKCTMFAMLSTAVHQQSFPLLGKFCAFAAKLRIGSMQEIAPFGPHPMASMVTSTVHLNADFEAFNPHVLAAHDSALGLPPQPQSTPPTRAWAPHIIGNRMIYAAKQQLTTHSVHVLSPAFKSTFFANATMGVGSGQYWFIHMAKKMFAPDSFRRVVHGMCYITDQYNTPNAGPLSISVPNLSVIGQNMHPHSPLGTASTPTTLGLMTMYVTVYLGEIGKGQTIYELVGGKAATTGESEVGKGVVLSGIPAEQMAAAQAMARLGTDDK